VARFHARALMQVRGTEIGGIVSRTTASAEQLAAMVRGAELGEWDCLMVMRLSMCYLLSMMS
jgi:hypothetical protein